MACVTVPASSKNFSVMGSRWEDAVIVAQAVPLPSMSSADEGFTRLFNTLCLASGKPFGAWQGPVLLPHSQGFDFEELVRAATALERALCDESSVEPVDYPPISALPNAMAATLIEAPTSDSSSRPAIPYALSDASACPAPASTPNIPDLESDEEGVSQHRKKRKTKNAHAARDRKRKKAKGDVIEFTHPKPRPKFEAKFVQSATPIASPKDLSTSKVVKTGFTALNVVDEEDQREHTLEELVGPNSQHKFRYVAWDGSKPVPILSPTGVLTGLLAGHPNDANWPKLADEAADLLKSAADRVTVKAGDLPHRRGAFVALPCGVSHGGGQLKPSNLGQASKTNEKVVEELNGSEPFQRISGYSNSVMATWAPELHAHYGVNLNALYKHDSELVPIFPRSVFAATSYNLGPHTACFPHTDFANLPYGWCAVTALGAYNYTTGGHIVLWDCGLVIEFPPGATILLPSATVTHSNTPVAAHETRYSFAQYTAGAIFRWVENGFQRSVDFYASIKGDEKKWSARLEKDRNRWAFGLSLLPVFELTEQTDAL